jgi:hypothetical protein
VPIRKQLHEVGAARAEDVFPAAMLAACSADLDGLIAAWEAGERCDEDFWACPMDLDGADQLYRIHRLETKSSWPAELTSCDGFTDLLAEVFAGPATATQCALTIKMAGAGVPVPWHRDPVDTAPGEVLNFSIYLDESTADNGCLHYLPGSHRDGTPASREMPTGAQPLIAAAGDVLVHDVLVQHGSPASRSATRRRAIVVEFTKGERVGVTRAAPIFPA